MVLDKEAYEAEMLCLLSDRTTYLPIKGNPTTNYRKELVDLVEEGFKKNIVSKKEKAFLIPIVPRVPVIYYSPKILKDSVCPLEGQLLVASIQLLPGWANILIIFSAFGWEYSLFEGFHSGDQFIARY